MLFSSFSFLFLFLPLVLGGYYILPKIYRNLFLLISSIVFYGWDKPQLVLLLTLVIFINFLGGIIIANVKNNHKKWLLTFVVLNIACLAYFKYTNFLVDSFNIITQSSWKIDNIVLPLGISFYIFQTMSYLIDVYRKECPAQENFIDFMLYISFFPQLIAGPIIKYHEIAEQIENRKETFSLFYYGIRRFVIGLAKKVLIANTLGLTVDKIFALPVTSFGTDVAWLGVIFYALQIYYDFSGYADMAIGLGAMFGFKIPENFNYPFLSKSYTEFWRRWHISLGTWAKEYIYIPLGGSRCSQIKNYFNLFTVFFIIGIWHGADMNMIMLGIYNGVVVVIEKMCNWANVKQHKFSIIIHHLYMIPVLTIAFLFLRSPALTYTKDYLLNMASSINVNSNINIMTYLNNYMLLIFCIACIFAFPISKNILHIKGKAKNTIINLSLVVLFCLSVISLLTSSYNPFIYFRF